MDQSNDRSGHRVDGDQRQLFEVFERWTAMDTRIPTPPMTPHKAVAAGIASLVVTLALSFLGWIPTSEDVLSADLQSLGEQLLA
jgi:hypothetical protein